MIDSVGKSLTDLKLSSDELKRLKKAFDDPEFRKLFKEYADEISDPKNRRKYEEEIRLMELDRGMDVKFVNPEPGYCLKSRHWPDLISPNSQPIADSCSTLTEHTSNKVFINVCKSTVVDCPEMKPTNKAGSGSIEKLNGCPKSGFGTGKHGWFWSLPHCFTPPHEEFDKRKEKVTVYDVAFHPKAFDLAATSSVMRRLITVTAVEGIQKQYGLRLGKTYHQAKQLAEVMLQTSDDGHLPVPSISISGHSLPVGGNNFRTSVNRDDLIASCFHTLKGVAYKGIARSAVIRNPRADWAQRIAATQRQDVEALAACATESQREAIRKLSAVNTHSSCEKQLCHETNPRFHTANVDNHLMSSGLGMDHKSPKQVAGSVKTPDYTITHSSDFDMLNCRDSADVDQLIRPDRLCVTIHLPGISTTNSVDLQVTATHLLLHSEHPVIYRLNLALPYPVDDCKGFAEFNKGTSHLRVTMPVLTLPQMNDADAHTITDSLHRQLVTGIPSPSTSLDAKPLINTGIEIKPTDENSKSNSRCRRRPNGRKRRNRRCSTAATTAELDTSDVSSGNVTSNTSTTVEEIFRKDDGGRTDNSRFTQHDTPPFTGPTGSIVGSITGSSVPVSWLSIHQLTVTKDRRLAPVRFRQDPFSLTVLLDVRGILPNSLSIYWSELDSYHANLAVNGQPPGGDQYSEISQSTDLNIANPGYRSTSPLLMLINFASRGSGGCTMDWGVVLCCPSIPPIASNEDACDRKQFSSDFKPVQQPHVPATSECSRPHVISYRLSSTNAVLLLAKPHSFPAPPSKNAYSSGSRAMLLAWYSLWWSSVATGRTLTAGMQDCPFIGMLDVCQSAPVADADLYDRPGAAEGNRVSATPTRSRRQLRVTQLSPECCQATWTYPQQVLLNDACRTQADFLSIDNATTATDNRSHITTHTHAAGTLNDPAIAVTSQQPPKGILKQRSYSESSGDEQMHLPYQKDVPQQAFTVPLSSSVDRAAYRLAGVAGTSVSSFLSSDEFPNASSSEEKGADSTDEFHPISRRRCASTDKLPAIEADGLLARDRLCSQPHHNFFPTSSCRPTDIGATVSVGSRQRRRSVNFSQHDQKLDYWPKDTVEALHFTLLHRKRKARRRQVRRNCSNSARANKVSHSSGTSSLTGEQATCQSQKIGSAGLLGHSEHDKLTQFSQPGNNQTELTISSATDIFNSTFPEAPTKATVCNDSTSIQLIDTCKYANHVEQKQTTTDIDPTLVPCQSAVELTSGVILELDC